MFFTFFFSNGIERKRERMKEEARLVNWSFTEINHLIFGRYFETHILIFQAYWERVTNEHFEYLTVVQVNDFLGNRIIEDLIRKCLLKIIVGSICSHQNMRKSLQLHMYVSQQL